LNVAKHHQEAISKADVLIEALGWIRRFRDKITVIKLGGSVMENQNALRHLLIDIVFMESVGMRPVVVHGGGAAIDRAMAAAGLEPKKIQGRRYTDDATLKIVEEVLAYQTCEGIVHKIEELGGRAVPLNFRSTNVLFGEKITLKVPAPSDAASSPSPRGEGRGEGANACEEATTEIDLGHVGRVTKVDRTTIENFCYADQVPVIPSMCLGPDGGLLNVNADTAATAVAVALGAEKLIFLSDVNGVRRKKDDSRTLINSLTSAQARQLIADGSIESGMIPKIEACLETLDKGVRKIHIIDGRLRHSLLMEIYTNKGVGTEMLREEA
jgi:acetylglutamate kinase